MSGDNFLQQIVVRRDGSVAEVTGISDGWLILDGSVDDSALPGEVFIVPDYAEDDTVTDLALAFGVDPLQAARVPDLARMKRAQAGYAYTVLQVVNHPTVDGAYLTILGVTDALRYRAKVKPEKGSSYEMLLSEASVRKFETEGVLPVKDELDYKPGDVVRLGKGDAVIILKQRTETHWHYIDPLTGDPGKVELSETLFPTSATVQTVIKTLFEAKSDKTIDSLRAEVSSLHKQLDDAQEANQSAEVQKLSKELETERRKHQDTQQALVDLTEEYEAVREDAAKKSLDLMRLSKEKTSMPVSTPAAAIVPVECKILPITGEAEFQKLWSQGWTCEHMQFTHDGKVRSVWRKDNTPPASGNDSDANAEVPINPVANAGFKAVKIEVPEEVEQPANMLGKYGTALMNHGFERTRVGMDAELELAVRKATGTYPQKPIMKFLPGGQS